MKTTMIVLLLVGVSASFAMPTTTAKPKPSMKDMVRMLLESSQLLQNWGDMVLDTSETGLNAASVQQLMVAGTDARQRFHDTVIQVSETMKEFGDVEAPETFDKDAADIAVALLKEGAKTEEFTADEKLALIAGDKVAVDTIRLGVNMRLFTRSMEILTNSVEELEGLLADEVTDAEIMEVLPELVEELGSEGTALGMLFKAIEESFEDGAAVMATSVDAETTMEKEETKEDTLSRKRRSPWNRDLGGGWSVGLGGVSWSRRNIHFNARPTFGRGGIGGRVGLRIEF